MVQEVSELRRSLEDAEGLSRDARKEWAILRSQNLSLEESAVGLSDKHPPDLHAAARTPSGTTKTEVFTCSFPPQLTLTEEHRKMEAEVSGLRQQLDKEKSRFKQMQNDLQRELNVAFDENTKLSALLEGKVPKSKSQVMKLGRTSVCVQSAHPCTIFRSEGQCGAGEDSVQPQQRPSCVS